MTSCVSRSAPGLRAKRRFAPTQATPTTAVYEVVPAKGTKVLREVNLGFVNSQSATLSCHISDAKT